MIEHRDYKTVNYSLHQNYAWIKETEESSMLHGSSKTTQTKTSKLKKLNLTVEKYCKLKLGKDQWKVNNFTSEINCKLQLNLLISYFYRRISNTFQCTWTVNFLKGAVLTLCVICVTRDSLYFVHFVSFQTFQSTTYVLRTFYCQNRSLPSNARFLYPQNFRSKSVRTSVYCWFACDVIKF